MNVPVVLVFITHHGKHLHHDIIDAFDTTIGARVVGACRDFVYAEQFVYGNCELSAELWSDVGLECGRAFS